MLKVTFFDITFGLGTIPTILVWEHKSNQSDQPDRQMAVAKAKRIDIKKPGLGFKPGFLF